MTTSTYLTRSEATDKLVGFLEDEQHYVLASLPLEVPNEIGNLFLGWDAFFDVGGDDLLYVEGAEDETAVLQAWAMANLLTPTAIVLVTPKTSQSSFQVAQLRIADAVEEAYNPDGDVILLGDADDGTIQLCTLSLDAINRATPGLLEDA
jgi:hypothetical protein